MKAPGLRPKRKGSAKKHPWNFRTFSAVAFIAVLAALVAAAVMMSFYISLKAAMMLLIILIVTLLAIGAVGAIGLRSNNKFVGYSFMKLMFESYRRLPLLRVIDPNRPLLKGEEED
jgi:hypothetical protein